MTELKEGIFAVDSAHYGGLRAILVSKDTFCGKCPWKPRERHNAVYVKLKFREGMPNLCYVGSSKQVKDRIVTHIRDGKTGRKEDYDYFLVFDFPAKYAAYGEMYGWLENMLRREILTEGKWECETKCTPRQTNEPKPKEMEYRNSVFNEILKAIRDLGLEDLIGSGEKGVVSEAGPMFFYSPPIIREKKKKPAPYYTPDKTLEGNPVLAARRFLKEECVFDKSDLKRPGYDVCKVSLREMHQKCNEYCERYTGRKISRAAMDDIAMEVFGLNRNNLYIAESENGFGHRSYRFKLCED